jgi:membrane-associated phospholipid phosphatase
MKEFFPQSKKTNVKLWLAPGRFVTRVFLAVILSLILFLIWVVFIYGKSSFDKKIFDLVDPLETESRTRIMLAISFFGNHIFLVPANLLLVLYFFIRKNKRLALRVAIVAISSVLVMSFFKFIFHRVRPENPLVPGITNFSFPSGHSFMAVAFYGLLIWLAAMDMVNKKTERVVMVILILLILAIGFSRIYLRVHYATDVIAGLCMGTAWLFFCLWIADKIEKSKKKI